MLSWFTTRVFMFPYFVIRSTLFESMVSASSARMKVCDGLSMRSYAHENESKRIVALVHTQNVAGAR